MNSPGHIGSGFGLQQQRRRDMNEFCMCWEKNPEDLPMGWMWKEAHIKKGEIKANY